MCDTQSIGDDIVERREILPNISIDDKVILQLIHLTN